MLLDKLTSKKSILKLMNWIVATSNTYTKSRSQKSLRKVGPKILEEQTNDRL